MATGKSFRDSKSLLRHHIDLGGPIIEVVVDQTVGKSWLTSEGLKESCDYCGNPNCPGSCDEITETMTVEGIAEEQSVAAVREIYNAAIDGMESLIMAAAAAGVDISSVAFVQSIQTAYDAICNNYDHH